MPHELDHSVLPPRALARVLGAQYLLGGVLAYLVAGTLVDHTDARGTVVALAALACVLGVVMGVVSLLRVSARQLARACHLCIFSAQCVIAAGYAATHDPGSPVLLFMLWTTPYAGVFGRRWRWIHMATTSAVLATAVLAMRAEHLAAAAVRAAIALCTVAVVTLLVARVTDRLQHAATHDALTGLPNRRLFTSAATEALRRRAAHGGTVAVLLLDLDRFKHVNDSFGHTVGDALLADVAPRLQAAVDRGDLVARLGGDEFAVVCERPDGDLRLDGTLQRLTAVASSPVTVGDRRLYVSGSIGVAVAQRDDTPETLLRDADVAMYEAKGGGGNRWRMFDPEATQRSHRLLAVEQGLRDAVRRGGLRMHYQPVVALDRRDVVGVEALMRWESSELGPVSPQEFIAVAERSGLIEELGDWALDRSLRDLAQWRRTGATPPRFHVAVNVSAHQLTDEFPGRVRRLLERHGVPASCLGLEITESAMMAEETSGAVLHALHDVGVVLLLDDFGTGHSSLTNLRRYPVDVVKVDRSFVNRMCQDPDDAAVVSGVLSLAQALGKHVVAEGIETAEQLRRLRAAGCPAGQGYLFSPAVPADQVAGTVQRLAAAPAAP